MTKKEKQIELLIAKRRSVIHSPSSPLRVFQQHRSIRVSIEIDTLFPGSAHEIRNQFRRIPHRIILLPRSFTQGVTKERKQPLREKAPIRLKVLLTLPIQPNTPPHVRFRLPPSFSSPQSVSPKTHPTTISYMYNPVSRKLQLSMMRICFCSSGYHLYPDSCH